MHPRGRGRLLTATLHAPLPPVPLPRAGCLRGGAADIKAHAWFAGVDWDAVYQCRPRAPFVPRVKHPRDTGNFDAYPDSDGDTAKRLSLREGDLFAEFDGY